LLEGFWLQIAAGAVLIACGLLLPRYIATRGSSASGAVEAPPGDRGARRRLRPRPGGTLGAPGIEEART